MLHPMTYHCTEHFTEVQTYLQFDHLINNSFMKDEKYGQGELMNAHQACLKMPSLHAHRVVSETQVGR